MPWRIYIFFLSATAAFCFMLLTAVTDYGTGGSHKRPLVSAASVNPETVLLSASLAKAPAFSRTAAPQRRETLPTPAPALVFVPARNDPVLARKEREAKEQAERGKPTNRNRLKWDENGWYREEIALTTAYCPCPKCCGLHSPGITSTGKNAWTPGLAADPLYLDYGTRVFVPGYGLSVVDDTGGAMRRHWRRNGLLHIDVRMTYHYEARQWGNQYLRVRIYEPD